MPCDNIRCKKCKQNWCGRDYYCEAPKDGKGIFIQNKKCTACGDFENSCCESCFEKCFYDDCNTIGCANKNRCLIQKCVTCEEYVCKEHFKSVGYGYEGDYTHYYCLECYYIKYPNRI